MPHNLPKKRLGQTDLRVTQLGYGSMGLRGPKTWGKRVVDDARAEAVLNEVLDSGINYIDTAPDYGECEERIGRFISHRRHEFILATKCGCAPVQHDDHLEIQHHWDRETIERNVETSLERMQTDSIDLLQFHGGDAETLQQAGLIDLLLEFKSQGLIKAIGVSTKLPNAEGLLSLGVFDTFQLPYSCLEPEHFELITRVHAAGAGTIVRGGIAQGGPEAEIQRPQLNDVWNAAKLDELLPDEMDKAELLLRMTLSHLACDTVIVGTCNSSHLASNIRAALAGQLPDDLVQAIRKRVVSAQTDRAVQS